MLFGIHNEFKFKIFTLIFFIQKNIKKKLYLNVDRLFPVNALYKHREKNFESVLPTLILSAVVIWGNIKINKTPSLKFSYYISISETLLIIKKKIKFKLL